jgi:hypothetical protein
MPRFIVLWIALFFVYPVDVTARITLVGQHKLSVYQQEDLEQIMHDMLVWIAHHSGYAVTFELPSIEFVSPETLAEGGDYGGPVAFFAWDQGRLQISEHLDVFQSPLDQAFLLHELVHYYQWLAGKSFKDNAWECQEDLALEVEAYVLQRQYYFTHGGRFMPAMIPVLFCDGGGQLKIKAALD